jgi:L-alanine-DL-glutamate epimerase-like enolase superfamily enzyme
MTASRHKFLTALAAATVGARLCPANPAPAPPPYPLFKPDAVQPNPTEVGGISVMRRLVDPASVFFKTVAPHHTKPALGTAANLYGMGLISNVGPVLEYVKLVTDDGVMSIVEEPVRFGDGLKSLDRK